MYERVRDAVKQKLAVAGGISQSIGESALAAKIQNLEDGSTYCCCYDMLFFSKVKSQMGGNVRLCITGGAPISKATLQFIRACFGHIIQGYGATETSAAASLTLACDVGLGHVGVPMPHTWIKLVDVPSMNYYAAGTGVWKPGGGQEIDHGVYKDLGYDIKENAKCGGEIWIYGNGVSSGYYDPALDDPSRGRETNGMNQSDFIEDGGCYWFKTGDIGRSSALAAILIWLSFCLVTGGTRMARSALLIARKTSSRSRSESTSQWKRWKESTTKSLGPSQVPSPNSQIDR